MFEITISRNPAHCRYKVGYFIARFGSTLLSGVMATTKEVAIAKVDEWKSLSVEIDIVLRFAKSSLVCGREWTRQGAHVFVVAYVF